MKPTAKKPGLRSSKPQPKPVGRRLWPIFFLLISAFAQAQDATAIVRKAEEKLRGKSSRAEIEIRIVRPKWNRTITAKSWSMGNEYSLILITAPARDQGTVFLKRNNEIWNYLPNIERSIKMPPSMMTQSWMGSDFNNDDLVRESSLVNDYTHVFLKDTVIRGTNCHKIQLTPKPNAAVVWGKVILYISAKDFMQLRGEQYDEDGYLVNVMDGFDPKPLGGQLLPSRMRITPVEQPGQYTELVYKDLEFNMTISEDFFSLQNMRSVR